MQLADAVNLPELTSSLAFGLGAGAVGIVLLLWGRFVHRAALLLAGASAGYLCGAFVAVRFNVNPLIAQIVAAVAVGVFALIAARLIWALLAGGVLAAIPLAIMLNRYLATTTDGAKKALSALQNAPDLHAFVNAMYNAIVACMKHLSGNNQTSLLFVIVPFVLVLLVTLLRPRLGAVVMTSVTGGLLLVAGLVLAGVTFSPSLRQSVRDRWYVPLATAGAAAIIGLVFQYRGAIRSDREHRREGAEPPEKRETKSADTDE